MLAVLAVLVRAGPCWSVLVRAKSVQSLLSVLSVLSVLVRAGCSRCAPCDSSHACSTQTTLLGVCLSGFSTMFLGYSRLPV